MHSHESETPVAPDGSVHVADRASRPDVKEIRDRLRGILKYYNDPFGPACDPSDWEASHSNGEPPEPSTRAILPIG